MQKESNGLLKKNFTVIFHTRDYTDILQSLVDSYSNTGHKSLGYLSPNDITEDNEADLWYYLYLKTTPKKSLKHKKSQSVNKHKK